MENGNESTGGTTGPKQPHLIPQPHGGALNSGGTPGNKGGRPREHIQRGFRELVELGLPYLKELVQGKVELKLRLTGVCEECGHEHEGKTEIDWKGLPSDKDRLRALEFAAQYSGIKGGADRELIGKLAAATNEAFGSMPGGREKLKELSRRWIEIIGEANEK